MVGSPIAALGAGKPHYEDHDENDAKDRTEARAAIATVRIESAPPPKSSTRIMMSIIRLMIGIPGAARPNPRRPFDLAPYAKKEPAECT